MSEFTVDVDREAVLLDETWYTADELAAKLQQMLGNKDFRIATAAAALEALQAALADVRDIGFRLPGTMLEALEATAGKEGRTTSAILRDALAAYLERKGEVVGPPVLAKEEGPVPAAGAPVPAAGTPVPAEGAPPVTVESLSVSEEEAATAVPLTPKKKADEESGWFSKK